jgi:hypothetical protein
VITPSAGKALDAVVRGGGAGVAPIQPRRLADLQDRIQAGQNRLAEIAAALCAKVPEVTTETVQTALAAFDGAWDAMPVADQCRLLSLLIDRVTYDNETVALTFRQNGFTTESHE